MCVKIKNPTLFCVFYLRALYTSARHVSYSLIIILHVADGVEHAAASLDTCLMKIQHMPSYKINLLFCGGWKWPLSVFTINASDQSCTSLNSLTHTDWIPIPTKEKHANLKLLFLSLSLVLWWWYTGQQRKSPFIIYKYIIHPRHETWPPKVSP